MTAVIAGAVNGKVLYKQTPPSLLFGFGSDSDHHSMLGNGKMGHLLEDMTAVMAEEDLVIMVT